MLKFITLTSAAVLLSACATAPVKQAPLPPKTLIAPAAFAGPQTAAAMPAPASGQWWLIFHDDAPDGNAGPPSQPAPRNRKPRYQTAARSWCCRSPRLR